MWKKTLRRASAKVVIPNLALLTSDIVLERHSIWSVEGPEPSIIAITEDLLNCKSCGPHIGTGAKDLYESLVYK